MCIYIYIYVYILRAKPSELHLETLPWWVSYLGVHFHWLLKKITQNCTVKNVKQTYRIRCIFTYAPKPNPNEVTEAADNFFPKTSRLALDTGVPCWGKSGQGTKLTIHLYPVPSLRMNGAISAYFCSQTHSVQCLWRSPLHHEKQRNSQKLVNKNYRAVLLDTCQHHT